MRPRCKNNILPKRDIYPMEIHVICECMDVGQSHFQVCLGFTVSNYSPRLAFCPWASTMNLFMNQTRVLFQMCWHALHSKGIQSLFFFDAPNFWGAECPKASGFWVIEKLEQTICNIFNRFSSAPNHPQRNF